MRLGIRKVLKVLIGCASVWLVFTLKYAGFRMPFGLGSVFSSHHDGSAQDKLLSDFVASDYGRRVKFPLEHLMFPDRLMLSFFHLPLRKYATSFTEITTANRLFTSPLDPDITIHIGYNDTEVVLYKDTGPGCVYRLFLYNQELSRRVKDSRNLNRHLLILVIDGEKFEYSLQQMAEAKEFPFVAPINTRHRHASSGIASYTPFCYQQDITISHFTYDKLPPNLFDQTINCSMHHLSCPVHIYSSISRHKFSPGTDVQSFADVESHVKLRRITAKAVKLLSNPEYYGPDSGESCLMKCMEVCRNCRRTMFSSRTAGIVTSIKVRLYNTATSTMLTDWSQVLISMNWDGSLSSQVDRVPLASLFGAGGSLNDLNGASMGLRKRNCTYTDTLLDFPYDTPTGYLYYPMPYWRGANIDVDGTSSLSAPLTLCYQVTTIDNVYSEGETGHFHVAKTYYTDALDGWRSMLSLNNHWGHVVGVLTDVDNLKPRGHSGMRWAAMEADSLLYVDGSKAATMMGTGLEDYFGYVHLFYMEENTSYAFVGVHHTSQWRTIPPSKPVTWHCYRLHLLDPIPFHTSIDFIMEGITSKRIFKPVPQLNYKEYRNLTQNASSATISHTVLYYAKPLSGSTVSDTFWLGDHQSEQTHQFVVVGNNQVLAKDVNKMERLEKDNVPSGQIFHVGPSHYLGAINTNQTFLGKGRNFTVGDRLKFTLDIFKPNRGVVLRRDFFSPIKKWNKSAKVWVNLRYQGIWYIPMGTLSVQYSLMQDDFLIGAEYSHNVTRLTVEIEAQSDWYDISYTANVIH